MKTNLAFLVGVALAITACGPSNSGAGGDSDTAIVTDSNILLDTAANDTGMMDTSVLDTGISPIPQP